ncbi:MAG: hypothetical protein JNG85_05675 [Spirochaetaceae bacterium]|nr:hypothetical protein [Spirochaetaceae bacterium]
MSDTSLHARSFDLRYCEMNGFGEATPVALADLLEEASFTHCAESGWDIYRLVGEGYGWVLLRGALEMKRYPRYGEGLVVETWVSEARRFYGTREYRIATPRGEELGYARALWLFLSLERRRPLPILDDIVAAWAPNGRSAGPLELTEVAGPAGPPGTGAAAAAGAAALEAQGAAPRFDVRFSDIDTNGHVNNVRYLSWGFEALPLGFREERVLTAIRGQYKREVTYGSAVSPLVAEGGHEGELALGIYAETPAGERYLAAAAETRWAPRPPEALRGPRRLLYPGKAMVDRAAAALAGAASAASSAASSAVAAVATKATRSPST